MVVVRAAPGVDQEEAFAVRDPVLLGAVVAQVAAVIPRPGLGTVEVQSVLAGRGVAFLVVTQRQVEPVPIPRQRRFGEPTRAFHCQFRTVSEIPESLPVEGTA